MPYNHTQLERILNDCDKRLDTLLKNEKEIDSNTIKQRIEEVKNYYCLSYKKAKPASAETIETIVTNYNSFVKDLEELYNETSIEIKKLMEAQALENVTNINQSRKFQVVKNNFAKICELLYWAATAFSLCAGIFGIALPVLNIQPALGVALSITIGGAMLAAGYKALSCLSEFRSKSLSRHNTEETNETELVSFFAKRTPKKQQNTSIGEEIGHLEPLSSIK